MKKSNNTTGTKKQKLQTVAGLNRKSATRLYGIAEEMGVEFEEDAPSKETMISKIMERQQEDLLFPKIIPIYST